MGFFSKHLKFSGQSIPAGQAIFLELFSRKEKQVAGDDSGGKCFLFEGISTTDGKHWRDQRDFLSKHLAHLTGIFNIIEDDAHHDLLPFKLSSHIQT